MVNSVSQYLERMLEKVLNLVTYDVFSIGCNSTMADILQNIGLDHAMYMSSIKLTVLTQISLMLPLAHGDGIGCYGI